MLKTVLELVQEARAGLRCLDAAAARVECAAKHGTVVDVREPGEVSAQAVAGSVNIPRGVLEMKITDIAPDAQHPLYLHCATGGRATLAARQLETMGYRNATVITCPIDAVCAAMAD
ncbi:hypothetical protein BST95_05035 [Halioglobus japonicus]|uniref:Rhodanese-like domain-containing protein n=1 Tax=Halioglobus japonicus TaxID=930805 RepID=A0AAP8MDP2_9GAMM|nr:rhodanese-like domain-containing protein [Halioglobus japonicus]AQA17693.1 hypothetical protein BST95_05035 [Halioglobus japonicus]PLW85642.1 rhodanese-like domain-containing protein [Halioglobus japonicus]GHD16712.1 rhodanese-like domain-containing protein [Halioglobus japonicus]